MISNTDLHWAAGYLEGEGCFYVRPSTNRSSMQARVTACSTDIEPLDKLYKLFGGHVRLHRKGTSKTKPLYEWYVSTQTMAIGIMMTLYSLLSPRRQSKIKECVARWKLANSWQ